MKILLDNPTNGQDWMELWLPDMQPLREHPQFQDILEGAGLITYWDEFGWPTQCSRDGETITCR
jgi:hypothetical protein